MSDSPLASDSRAPWSPRDGVALISLAVLALVCWSPGLHDGYWIDEVISRDTASGGWADLLARTGFGDVHPPLYYALLKAWSGVVGSSDFAGRVLSLVLGLGSITLMFVWVRRRSGWIAGLLGAGILVICPLTVHYAVEVRSYSLLLFLSLAGVVTMERWLERPGCHRRLGLCAVVLSLSVLTHYFGWLWAFLLVLYALGRGRRSPGVAQRLLLLCLSVLGSAAFWLPLLLVQVRHLPGEMTAHLASSLPPGELLALFGPGAGHPSGAVGLGAGVLILVLATLGGWTSARAPAPVQEDEEICEPPSPGLFIPPLLLVAAAPLVSFSVVPMSELLMDLFLQELPTVYGALVVVAALVTGLCFALPRLRRLPPGTLEVAVLLVGFLVLGALALFRPVLTPRNLILFLPPILSLFVLGLLGLPRWSQLLVLALMVLVAGTSLPGLGDRFQARADLRGAAERIGKVSGPIAVWPRWDAPGLGHYMESQPHGVLSSDDLPSPAGDSFDVVLTRQSAEEADRFLTAVSAHLGSRFAEVERWEGRKVVWCRFQRASEP